MRFSSSDRTLSLSNFVDSSSRREIPSPSASSRGATCDCRGMDLAWLAARGPGVILRPGLKTKGFGVARRVAISISQTHQTKNSLFTFGCSRKCSKGTSSEERNRPVFVKETPAGVLKGKTDSNVEKPLINSLMSSSLEVKSRKI